MFFNEDEQEHMDFKALLGQIKEIDTHSNSESKEEYSVLIKSFVMLKRWKHEFLFNIRRHSTEQSTKTKKVHYMKYPSQ